MNKILINSLEWEIKEVETRSSELWVNGKECFGTCKYPTQEIFIDSTLKSDKKYQTIKHELTHAFLYCYMLESKQQFSEEELCEFVANYADQIICIARDYIYSKEVKG